MKSGDLEAQRGLFKLRNLQQLENKTSFSPDKMDLCYSEQFLPQYMHPYTYYLAYLPTFAAQNYAHSTFAPVPLYEPQVPLYTHPSPIQTWNLPSQQPSRQPSTALAPKKIQGAVRGEVIQHFQNNKKEEECIKAIQKESRNVVSNLLRILFKNILEVRMYDDLIGRIIDFHGFSTTTEDFYRWLQGYNINYKNYIRFCSVKKIMGSKKRKDHLAIFRVLLKEYIKVGAITHCLTSKRIDRPSMEMHLQGLRQLRKDLLQA